MRPGENFLVIQKGGSMRRRLLSAVVLAAAVSPVSAASLSSTITLASDYLFDGVSQTQGDSSRYWNPALQTSLDLSFANGFYLGMWASNIDFGAGDPADIEIDFYGGYGWELANGTGFDLGLAHYSFTGAPTRGYDYTEAYLGVTFPQGTGLKLFVADDDDVFDGRTARLKGTHSFRFGDAWSLDLEATRTDYERRNGFWHGQIGVTRTAGQFDLYLGYVDTDLNDEPAAQGRFLFTVTTTIAFF
jgi:uncharacterized protein (TIGR02001 family)